MDKNKKIKVSVLDGEYTSTYGRATVTTRSVGYIKSYLSGILDCLEVDFDESITIERAVEIINAEPL